MQPIPGHSTTYQVLKQGQGSDLAMAETWMTSMCAWAFGSNAVAEGNKRCDPRQDAEEPMMPHEAEEPMSDRCEPLSLDALPHVLVPEVSRFLPVQDFLPLRAACHMASATQAVDELLRIPLPRDMTNAAKSQPMSAEQLEEVYGPRRLKYPQWVKRGCDTCVFTDLVTMLERSDMTSTVQSKENRASQGSHGSDMTSTVQSKENRASQGSHGLSGSDMTSTVQSKAGEPRESRQPWTQRRVKANTGMQRHFSEGSDMTSTVQSKAGEPRETRQPWTQRRVKANTGMQRHFSEGSDMTSTVQSKAGEPRESRQPWTQRRLKANRGMQRHFSEGSDMTGAVQSKENRASQGSSDMTSTVQSKEAEQLPACIAGYGNSWLNYVLTEVGGLQREWQDLPATCLQAGIGDVILMRSRSYVFGHTLLIGAAPTVWTANFMSVQAIECTARAPEEGLWQITCLIGRYKDTLRMLCELDEDGRPDKCCDTAVNFLLAPAALRECFDHVLGQQVLQEMKVIPVRWCVHTAVRAAVYHTLPSQRSARHTNEGFLRVIDALHKASWYMHHYGGAVLAALHGQP
ncbi:unnamed protein product [Symbiodinium sp. CCMP2592]|nr:unnamed protein product [Symbiodinium sp. CCMP2592]